MTASIRTLNVQRLLLSGSVVLILLFNAIEKSYAEVSRMSLLVSGTSVHFKDADHNEQNYGVGFSYLLPEDNLVKNIDLLRDQPIYFEFDAFKDSFSDIALSAGLAYKKKVFNYLNIGFKAGLLKSKHVKREHDLYLIPYLVPIVESAFDFPINLRWMLIPPVGDITNGYMMFQFVVDL